MRNKHERNYHFAVRRPSDTAEATDLFAGMVPQVALICILNKNNTILVFHMMVIYLKFFMIFFQRTMKN